MEKDYNVLIFDKPLPFSDQIFLVEQQEFHVHRIVLTLWSPVFRTMFSSSFIEATSEKIEVPGKNSMIFFYFYIHLMT